jgi:hypothetical protein
MVGISQALVLIIRLPVGILLYWFKNCLILPGTLDNPVYTEVYRYSTLGIKQKNSVITRHSSSRKISLHIVHCDFSAVLVVEVKGQNQNFSLDTSAQRKRKIQ